jgi:hypothetical protein
MLRSPPQACYAREAAGPVSLPCHQTAPQGSEGAAGLAGLASRV